MTPATSAAAKTGLRRAPAPRTPRRVSGPARPQRTHGGAASHVLDPRGARLARVAMRVGDAPLLDRLVRGRAWIAIVAVGLLGIVFMQVSMLKLNGGVGRAVTSADTLERQNAALRQQISQLGSDERVRVVAADLGMTMSGAGDPRYLDARQADPRRAARSIKEPAPVAVAAPVIAAPAATSQSAGATTAAEAPAPVTDQAVAASAPTTDGATTPDATGADTAPAPAGGTQPGATTTQQGPATTPSPDQSAAGGAAAPPG